MRISTLALSHFLAQQARMYAVRLAQRLLLLAFMLVTLASYAQPSEQPNEQSAARSALPSPPCVPLSDNPVQNVVNVEWRLVLCSPPNTKLPCLSSVCLGDNILQRIDSEPWIDLLERVKPSILRSASDVVQLGGNQTRSKPPSPPDVLIDTPQARKAQDLVRNHVLGLTEQDKALLLLYAASGTADKRLFQLLARTTPTFCRNIRLVALFNSPSGHLTTVAFEPMARGEFRVFLIGRGIKFDTSDELSRDETRRAIADAHPLIFKYTHKVENSVLFAIENRRVSGYGVIRTDSPRFQYELVPSRSDSSATDIFDHASQPGCAAKAQPVN